MLLERLRREAWRPRTTLLSPFDTLINDRDRTELLFDFRFRLEIYAPKEKREYGYFVMPILHGERLIGRIAPTVLRDQARLAVEAVYAEPDAPRDRATGRAVAGAVEELARFLGAREITYGRNVPPAWKAALRSSTRGAWRRREGGLFVSEVKTFSRFGADIIVFEE